ncbi:cupin domain-containing protein [Mycobacterium sp. NPDC003449]
MQIWRIAADDYWGITPPEAQWAGPLAAAGEQQGLRTTMHVLGDPSDEGSPAAVVVEYPPDYVLPRHSHDGARLELVVRGAVEVDGQWLGPGDIWASGANQFYGPHNVGPQGCTTLELATTGGIHRLTFDAGDNTLKVDFSDPESVAVAAEFLA